MDAELYITMPDGSVWAVPVEHIARNRATFYAHREYGGNVEESLRDDTIPLFESDDYEIEDWAAGNMNWEDVSRFARMVSAPEPPDFQEGWVNGDKRVVRK